MKVHGTMKLCVLWVESRRGRGPGNHGTMKEYVLWVEGGGGAACKHGTMKVCVLWVAGHTPIGLTVNLSRQLATTDSIMRICSVHCVILSNSRETPYKHGVWLSTGPDYPCFSPL